LRNEITELKEALVRSSIELGLLKKKRELALAGDLRGRHLTAQERTGLLEIIRTAGEEGMPLSRAVEVLEVNRRAVYRWIDGTTRKQNHGGGGGQNKIKPAEELKILEFVKQHPQMSVRRISYELERNDSVFIGKTVVAEIMVRHGLNNPFVKYPPQKPVAGELSFEPWRSNLIWGMDWTYIRIAGKFYFLIVVIDWYSRKIVAWGLYPSVTRFEVVATVTDAVAKENLDSLPECAMKPIVVADHGSANNNSYTEKNLEILGLDLWLCGIGRPTGNARTERVIGTLRREELNFQYEYSDEPEAQKKISKTIFDYNYQRPNQGNGSFAPALVHQHGRSKLTKIRREARQQSEIERRNHWMNEKNHGIETVSSN
jgi:putative transposase